MGDLQEAVAIALSQCMGLEPHESVLIVTDGVNLEVAEAFYAAAGEMARDYSMVVFPQRARNGEEPPASVAAAMKEASVVLVAASRSLSHTRARREACLAGARVASMPGITQDMAARALRLDYAALARRSEALARMLTEAKEARLTSPGGTLVTLSLEGRQGMADTGILREPGRWGNLPAGEACIAPLEGLTQGVIVLDGTLAGWGSLEEPITLVVEAGIVKEVSGGKAASWLRENLDAAGPAGRNIAELGVGTNDRARITGILLEDEKVLGTAHVAMGNSLSLGGRVDASVHLDGVVFEPVLELDGQVVLEGGHLRVGTI
ncbi:MAG: aminopeptidase [Bacillota bacterium]